MRGREVAALLSWWALAVGVPALSLAWIGSIWVAAGLGTTSTTDIGIGGGAFFVYRHPLTPNMLHPNLFFQVASVFHWMPFRNLGPASPAGAGVEYGVPMWPLVLATGLTGAAVWRRQARHRRRLRAGLCVSCGHDLRGVAPARDPACPECGTVPAPASK